MRPSERLLNYFDSSHLQPYLADTVDLFGDVAQELDRRLPESAEKTTALRKLLEAKDCALRAQNDACQDAQNGQ